MAIAIVLLAIARLRAGRPSSRSSGCVAFGALAVAAARLLPLVAPPAAPGARPVPRRVGGGRAGAGRRRRGASPGSRIALAAFIAGLAISDSPDAAEARRRLLPFRDVFAVFFFVAIGTLIDPARALRPGCPGSPCTLALVVVAKSAVACGPRPVTGLAGSPLQRRRRAGPDRRVQLRAGLGRPSPAGPSARSVRGGAGGGRATIAGSTILVRLVRASPGRADPDRRGVNRAEPVVSRSGSSRSGS